MKRYLAIIALTLLPLAAPARAETISRIAAVVNDEIITTYRLDQEVAERLKAQSARQFSAAEMDALRNVVLSDLIEDTLVRQRTAELGLQVSDEEVEAAILDVQNQNKLTREQLIQALQFEGMTYDGYRENLRRQILRFKLLGREVQSKVEVTNQEIRDYFREHIDDYRELPSVRLSRITFAIPDKANAKQIAAVKARAEEALARLRKGEDFYGVLLAYSADKSADGGDMGTFTDGELTPAFARAVQDLKQGEVSAVIETPEGFHLLQLTERNAGKIRQFDEVKGEIQKKLAEQKTEARFKEWAQGLRKKAYIDIRL